MAKNETGKATGFYHSPHAVPKRFTILTENEDGTVNIGIPNGTTEKDRDGVSKPTDLVVVRNCTVSDVPKPGHFTRADAAAEKAADKKLTKAADQKFSDQKDVLNGKTKDELLAEVDAFNTTSGAENQIRLAPNASKSDIVAALLLAEGFTQPE